MTISSSVRKAGPFTGNSSATSFPFTFKIFVNADIVATLFDGVSEAVLVLGSDYSVTMNADQDSSPGGSVTYPLVGSAMTSAYTLTLTSDISELQPTSLENQGGFYPKVIEHAFDRGVILIQQLRELADRSLRYPVSDPSLTVEMPPSVDRANTIFAFDANGNPTAYIPVSGSAADVLITLAGALGSSYVGFKQSGAGAVARTVQGKAREHASVLDYGDVEGGVANATAAFLAAATAKSLIEIPAGIYLLNTFPSIANKTYIALGKVTINFVYGSTPVFLAAANNCHYEGIDFVSLETNRANQRIAIDDVTNVEFNRCSSTGFRDTSTNNAWGILIQRSGNIRIRGHGFYNNTQSDIAITDSCNSVLIENLYNYLEGGVYLNIEPNTIVGARGLNIIGGDYRRMDLLEPETSAYSSQNIVVSGARITQLTYDGAGASFVNSGIGIIQPEGSALTLIFSGPLTIDSCDLGQNLLDDPYLFDVSPSDTSCFWTSYTSSGTTHTRSNDAANGKYATINTARANQQTIITTRNYIPVTAGEVFVAFLKSRCQNSGTGVVRTEHLIMQWFDASHVEIQTTHISGNRAPNNTNTGWNADVATPKAPVGAAYLKVRLTNFYDGTSTSSLQVASVGLFRFTLQPLSFGGGNMASVLGKLAEPVAKNDYYVTAFPTGAAGYGGMLVGEKVILKTPVAGAQAAQVCTVAGTGGDPGTLIASGVAGESFAGHVSTTSGATLGQLETNVNLIITNLIAAKKMI